MANIIRDINTLASENIKSFDQFLARGTVEGSIDKAIGNNLYGLNHQNTRGKIPVNKDNQGMVFFTRPQLNLRDNNLTNLRTMHNLLGDSTTSLQRYVRCMLDPRLAYMYNINSALVDPKMPFIPVLTNDALVVSGWPDVTMPTYVSKEGVRKEQYAMADGVTEVLNSYDLDVTFLNSKTEPITFMMQVWLNYMAGVFEGTMSPYLDMITENELDYNTRIYRIVLDETKRYVSKISATGASFPVNAPLGKYFDYNQKEVYNMSTKESTIRFKCVGAMYNDAILIRQFNETNAIFNGDIRAMMQGKSHNLIKIHHSVVHNFNNRGYPYINEDTYELEWYINKDSKTYLSIKKDLGENNE